MMFLFFDTHKRPIWNLFAIFALVGILAMSACSPTKYLTEGQALLSKNEIRIMPENDTVVYDFQDYDIGYLIRPNPNSKLFFVRLNARIYNLRNPESVDKAITKYQEKKEEYIIEKKKLDGETKLYLSNRKKHAKHINKIEKLALKIKIIDTWTKVNSTRTQELTINSDQNYRRTYRAQLKKELKTRQIESELKNIQSQRDAFAKQSREYKSFDKKLKKEQQKRDDFESADCNKLHWTRKAGEAPVLYRINDEFRNIRQIRIFLKNKGYYNARVRADARIDGRQKKKVIYTVFPDKPYVINRFVPESQDTAFLNTNPEIKAKTILSKGTLLDVELLENERQRIYEMLRNKGYYKFSKDYISYSIDTLNGNSTANVRLIIKLPIEKNMVQTHKQFKINAVNVFPSYNPKAALTDLNGYLSGMDTIIEQKFYFLSDTDSGLYPSAIAKGTYIFPDSLYRSVDIRATYKYLSSMKIIKIANIDFVEIMPEDSTLDNQYGYLDCNIKLTQNERQAFTAELEATNTSGDIGAAGNVIYSHKNLFKSAEVFDMRLKGALERKVSGSSDGTDASVGLGDNPVSFFNSYEIGADMSLEFPRLFAPGNLTKFIKKNNPKTTVSTNLNLLSRPDYKREVAGFSFGYFWNTSPEVRHTFKPILFDLVRLRNPSEEFLNYINRYKLYESYEDHLILGTSYSISYTNSEKKTNPNQIYLRINGKLAGNTLYTAMNVINTEKIGGSYQIGGNSFAQFAKLDVDFRYYRKIFGSSNKMVFRTFVGAVYPYGNLNVVPFGEKYFTGGANGIRAWQVRTLGPGSYHLPALLDVFPNQTADIKLETNLEYRFKMFWMLEGALFVDAGNIWAINDTDDRLGAQFEFDGFYKDIAVGTGAGFRFDFDFFIIRFDVGLKLRDPSTPEGLRWVHAHRSVQKTDWAFNVGIGYPF